MIYTVFVLLLFCDVHELIQINASTLEMNSIIIEFRFERI